MEMIKKLRKLMKAPLTMMIWACVNALIFVMISQEKLLLFSWWTFFSFAFIWFWYSCQYEPPKPPMTIERFRNETLIVTNGIVKGYIQGIDKHGSFITCLKCGSTSYNGNDIKNFYCAKCNKFHT